MTANAGFASTLDELRSIAAGAGGRPPQPPVEPGQGSGDDPGMEARLKRLEDDVQGLRIDAAQATARLGGVETRLDGVATRLGGVETRLGGVESRLAGVEGKLDLLVTQVVGKIPSGMQMFGIFVGTLVAGVTILGGAIKAAQVLRLIPPA